MFDLELTRGITITPDLAQWKAFRQELDRIQVWRWQSRYDRPAPPDGESWYVVIVDWPRQFIYSSGNVYPENWDDFLRAIRALVGGREFE